MTGKGHTLAGLVCMIGMYKYSNELGGTTLESIIATVFILLGATAPDWLEIRKSNGATVIRHRTWTHWLPLWIILLAFGLSQGTINHLSNTPILIDISEYINTDIPNYVSYAIIGFSIGGLLHLATDLPNPMGIPILTPYHRFSLKLWKSGKFEGPICWFLLFFNLYYIKVINIDFSVLNL